MRNFPSTARWRRMSICSSRSTANPLELVSGEWWLVRSLSSLVSFGSFTTHYSPLTTHHSPCIITGAPGPFLCGMLYSPECAAPLFARTSHDQRDLSPLPESPRRRYRRRRQTRPLL